MADRPTVPHPLPDPLVDLIAHRFRVLGEPMRIKLLDRLGEGPATVQELQSNLAAGSIELDREWLDRLDAIREDPASYWQTRAALPWN